MLSRYAILKHFQMFIRVFLLGALALFSMGCTLSVHVKNLNESTVSDSNAPTAIISGALTGISDGVNISLTISGTGIVSYRYKILASPIVADCDDLSGYSAEETVANSITQSIAGLADGLIKVCVIGKNELGTWQSLTSATVATWTKATIPPYTDWNQVGSGTLVAPYEIYTKAQLLDIGVSACNSTLTVGCSAHFVIKNSIDLNNEAYIPIGDDASGNCYSGTFNGGGFTVSNLFISTSTQSYQGFIGCMTSAASLADIVFTGATVTLTGGTSVAGVAVGVNDGGAVSDVTVSNSTVIAEYGAGVIGRANGGTHVNLLASNVTVGSGTQISIAGLVSYCDGCSLSNSSSSGTLSGFVSVGGAVASATAAATLSGVSSSASITAVNGSAGGLVGSLMGTSTITNSYSSGSVTNTTSGGAGGLVGSSSSTAATIITNSTATGAVTSAGGQTGGFIGAFSAGAITGSTATGRVIVTAASQMYVGGFAGYINGTATITNCAAVGDVTATNSSQFVGGFLGYAAATANQLNNVIASGVVKGYTDTGGIVGGGEMDIYRAIFVGRVEGRAGTGGLVGDSIDHVWYSQARATVYASASSSAGGLAGSSGYGFVNYSVFDGDVYGNNSVGGGFGSVAYGSLHASNHIRARVFGATSVGGLVGYYNMGNDVFNNSQVEAYVNGNLYVGGIVGQVLSSGMDRIRFDGVVVGGQYVGGVAGNITNGVGNDLSQIITNALVYSADATGRAAYSRLQTVTYIPTKTFWNSDLSSLNGSDVAVSDADNYEGKTTVELKSESTYTSGGSPWDFTSDWAIDEGVDYPVSKLMITGQCSDYKTATSYSAAGSGTSASPYLICTLAQYNDIGTSGCNGSVSTACSSYFRIGANIDFRSSEPVIIGSAANPFAGHIDGQIFKMKNILILDGGTTTEKALIHTLTGTIANVQIESSEMNVDGTSGFVAAYLNGNIYNVRVTDSQINAAGGSQIGGLAGRVYGGRIIGSEFSGTISASDSVGGLVGHYNTISSPGKFVVSNSFSNASMTVTGDYVGGLAGLLENDNPMMAIYRSVSLGSISGNAATSDNLGGLAGSGSYIHESSSGMNVSGGHRYIAGLLGLNGRIHNSYSTATSISGEEFVAALAGGNTSAYSSFANVTSVTETVRGTPGGLGTVGALGGGADSFWNSTLSGISSGSSANIQTPLNSTQVLAQASFANWDFTNIWSIGESVRAPMLKWRLHPVCQANMTATAYNSIGAGTPSNPYKICFKEQLHSLAATCGGSATGCGSNYLVLNDIDFGGDSFAMIGSSANNFTGVFDGGGRRIANFSIGGATTDYVGFFRFASSAYITQMVLENVVVLGQNAVGAVAGAFWAGGVPVTMSFVNVKNVSVTGAANVGGAVGITDHGKIYKVSVSGTVTGTSEVGGLVGGTNNSSGTNLSLSSFSGTVSGVSGAIGGLAGDCSGTISKSSFKGDVSASGSANVGGLCGFVWSGNFLNNTVLGNISGGDSSGGFLGYTQTATIENNFYNGTVTASGTYRAGFIGRNGGGTVRYNLSVAAVSGVTNGFMDYVGAGTYTNNYWDSTVSGISTGGSAGNYDPLTTIQAQSQGNYTGWNFNEKWIILPNQYPEPR